MITVSEDFVRLVQAMRERQREFFAKANDRDHPISQHEHRRLLQTAKGAEQRVDEWLMKYAAEQVQLTLWSRGTKGSEAPAPYNATREEDLAKHG